MSDPAWEQPEAPRPGFLGSSLAPRIAAGLLVAVPALAPMLLGSALPAPLAVASVAAGLFLIVRQFRAAGGPWEGFTPPAGLDYTAKDPEFGSTLGPDLAFPAHDFENILRGHGGGWDWVYFEATQGVVRRERLVVIDLGHPVPPTRAVRNSAGDNHRAVLEASMPGLVTGRTGQYLFPGSANPDPRFRTALITPAMTAVLESSRLPLWETRGQLLVAHTADYARITPADGVVADAAALARIATLIVEAARPRTTWPTEPAGWEDD